MAEKTYTETVIQDNPFPQSVGLLPITISNQPSAGGSYSETKISNQEFPTKRIAQELISDVLNTKSRKILKEVQFTKSGALQIGEYQNGITGDIRISPSGLVARDSAGNNTVTIDGSTGDATFKGEVRSGSLVTGDLIVGVNAVLIDGANRRIIVNDGTNDRVLIGRQVGGF